VIGLTGDTGLVTAAHLHFEVYVDGTREDPYAWLP
jgi:murein DD-endopeptidase MepM/ murein hydrolase activator NlpD